MRVLRTEGSNQENWIPRICTHRGQPYAILSHRWFEDANHEVLFGDIEEIDRTIIDATHYPIRNAQYAGTIANTRPGYRKIQGAANQARAGGMEFIWVDTCCIDKNSSAELSEAINSMFKWYKNSAVCYAYLADVPDATDPLDNPAFAASQWWKRGWTLQELLAPPNVLLFSLNWALIGRRAFLQPEITRITGIHRKILAQKPRELDFFCIAQRMSWASGRTTTRPEDMAYCLMGLFDIRMPILYGEGDKAFIRLQEEIIKHSDDESIFAWRDACDPTPQTGLLATRPSAFGSSRGVDMMMDDGSARAPWILTNKGLSIALPLHQPQQSEDGIFVAQLRCLIAIADKDGKSRSSIPVGIYLKQLSTKGVHYHRVWPDRWAETAQTASPHSGSVVPVFIRQSYTATERIHLWRHDRLP